MRKMILGFPVAIMLMAASAQAQGAVWSATFTPGDINGYAFGCRNGDDDAECSNKDVLSDDTFTVGEIVYTVTEFYQTSGTNRLYFAGIRTPEDGTSWVDIADELKIGSTSLDIGDAFLSQGQNNTSAWRLRWSGDPGLDDVLGGDSLTDGTSISVTLISGDLPPPPPPPTTPGAPTGLAATANGPSQIDLAWTAPASTGGSAITGYKIEVSPDGSSWSDLVADTGSTDTAYAHMGLDPATTRHYRVSAINAVGTSNASDSDDTTTASTNTAPTGAPTITGTAEVGETLTAVTTGIADADGLTRVSYTYQWIRVDGTDEADIASANSSTYILVDADLGKTLKVRVTFDDDLGHTETLTSAATATVGAVATAPAVSTVDVTSMPASGDTYGTGETIQFTVTFDQDVTVTGTPEFEFCLGNSDGGSCTDGSPSPARRRAALSSGSGTTELVFSYTVVAGDMDDNGIWIGDQDRTIKLDTGDAIRGRVGGLDAVLTHPSGGAQTGHKVNGGAAATGPTVNDVAVTSMPASGTTYYLAGEVIEFTVTFSAPVTVTATPKFAFRLGAATRQAAYASGSDSAALVFARTVQAGEVDRNGISWNALALALDGGTITQTGATTAASLTHAEQAPLEGHRVDAAPPMQVSASVHGMSLVLVYDEPLDPASMPATGAYTVTATVGATTTNPAVSEVSIYGIWVTLTLDAAPAAGATVTLAYAPPASNPVQDEAGNDAPAFSGQSVRLGPPPPDLEQVLGVGVVPGNAQLVVTWTAVDNATGYTVQWKSGGQGYNTTNRQATVTSGTTTSHTITGLANGTEYTVQVSATRTGANDGPPSDEMTGTPFTTPPPPPPPVTDLAQVLGVSVAPGNAQLVVTWTAVDNATGYTVQWKSSGQGYNSGDRQATVTSGSTTSHTITGLANGTEYTVQVSATRTGANDGPPSDEMTGTPFTAPPPPPPPDLEQVLGVGVVPGNAQLVVTWTAVDNATGYTVQWKSSGQGYNSGDRQATVTSGTTTSHAITGLANGTEYTVQVSATRTGANDGPPSDEMTGTPTVPTAAGITVSTAGLTVTEQDSTGDGYTVVLDTEPTADVVVTVAGHVGTDVTANPTALTFTMSNWETAQTVTVTADDDADTTDDSVALTHSAASADSGYSGIAIAGVAVTVTDNDTAQVLGVGVAPGNAQLVVTWTAVDNATGYTVQWTSGGQGYNTGDRQATVTSGTTTSHTITGLANGTEYTVQVSATRTGANDGPPSDEMTGTPFTTPPPPPPPVTDLAQVLGVSVTPGNAQLVVTWTAVDNATGYTVQWKSGSQAYNTTNRQATVTSGSTTSHTITGLANGTEYTVRVIATRTGANDGPPSAEVTASPVNTPGAPQHLSAVPGYEQVTLTWDAPSSDGGSAILRYEVAVDDSGTWIDAGLDLEETVTGLTNGQRYTFAVRAVNAAGTGPAATVTIVTSHPLPQAWLARFGRAATDHVVDAVSSRWQGGPQASHLTIGGVQTGALFGWIGRVGQAARDTAEDRGDPVRTETSWTRLFAPSGGAGTGGGGTGPGMTVTDRNTGPVGLGGVDRKAGATLSGRAAQGALLGALGLPDPRALTDLRAALLGSSFFYSGARDEDGQPRTPGGFGEWSVWGRGAASWFSGTDSGLSLDGEVVTAMLGFDSRWERWLAGVVVSHSRGQGTYTHPTATGGAVASSLTALHPYAGYKFNERTSIWGVLGYGVGEMSLTPERSVTALETGLMNAMAAVGGRTALLVRSGPARRFELAIRSDARLTNTASDAVGAMAGAAGQTHRVRMMLEGSGVMPLASGGVLKPRLEAGLRYDAGDAETGAGLEVGGGLGGAFGRLSLEVNARGLLAHRDTQYEEWGFSGAVAYTPSKDGRGVSLRLGSGWGATHSGVQSLWRRQDASDLVRHAEFDAAQRYQVELRYGLDGLKGRVRWTPYIGVESVGGSSQALRLGVTLTSGRRFDAGLELGRRQGGPGAGPEHAGQISATLLW